MFDRIVEKGSYTEKDASNLIKQVRTVGLLGGLGRSGGLDAVRQLYRKRC